MRDRDKLLGRETAPLLAAGLIAGGISLAALLIYVQPTRFDAACRGVAFGTLFGQVSLAAAWTALGPFRLISRLPLAAAWIAVLILLVGVGDNRVSLRDLLIFSGAFAGQWLVVQAPLWILVGRYGLRMAHRSDGERVAAASQQFGIVQLMILTAIVAVVLGAGRGVLGGLQMEESYLSQWTQMARLYESFVILNTLITLPILAAALLPGRAAIAIAAALSFGLAIAALEVWLLQRILSGARRDLWLIVLIKDLIQSAWILGIVGILRAGGYRLGSRLQPSTEVPA